MTLIKADLVKKLREKTNVSMMECKKALEKTNGDVDAAIALLEQLGAATAVKKQSRAAAEGAIVINFDSVSNSIAMLEINCETDFVAKNSALLDFANKVVKIINMQRVTEISEVNDSILADHITVEQARTNLINQLGENIILRRAELYVAQPGEKIGYYLHGKDPAKIAGMVCIAGGTDELAKDLALHIVGIRSDYFSMDSIPKEIYEQQTNVIYSQTKLDNPDKPEDIFQKIVNGRVNTFFKELTFMTQTFIKDPKFTVEKLLVENKAKIIKVIRMEVGEGLHK